MLSEFDFYQQRAYKTAIYPETMKVVYPTLGLAGEVGEIANKVKKIYRDNNGVISDEVRIAIGKELGDCLWYLGALATDLNLSLTTIALENLEKLYGRQERGTLSGSGDER